MRKLCSGVLALATALAICIPLRSQSALPTKLVQQSDLVYQGSFSMPASSAGDFDYAEGVIAFNPAKNSLFVVGSFPNGGKVAEVSIPSLGSTATLLQPFRDALEGKISQVNPGDSNGFRIGGMAVIGDKLVIAANAYYDGGGTARVSHFVRSTALTTVGVSAPFKIGTLPVGFTAGYFAPIPAAWQSALGANVLNGECCLNIISRTSYGPAISSVNTGTLLASVNGPATALLGYPSDHPLEPYAATGVHVLWNGATKINGVAFPDNTATVLFFGMQGVGQWCYGDTVANGGSCAADNVNPYKGAHAPPYQGQVWAYNANDLAAVKNGAKQMWEVKPYATWGLPDIKSPLIGGATIDPSTGRIYVSDTPTRGGAMTIKVYSVAGSMSTADSVAPTVTLTSPSANAALTGLSALAATASDNVGVSSVWFTVDGATVGSEDTSAPYQLSWNTTSVANGSHALRALARDAAGNVTTSSPVTVSVSNGSSGTGDKTAPTVAVTSPKAGMSVSGSVALAATATDNIAVASVQFMVDGKSVGSPDTSSPYQATWSASAASKGSHTIQAIARDAAGNSTTSAAVSVTIAGSTSSDTTPPTVAITSPRAGTRLDDTVRLTAQASDNVRVASVQFAVDGVVVGTATGNGSYTFNWNTSRTSNSSHSISAIASDTSGNKRTSSIVKVTVSNGRGR